MELRVAETSLGNIVLYEAFALQYITICSVFT
jgi:hypothetical protein